MGLKVRDMALLSSKLKVCDKRETSRSTTKFAKNNPDWAKVPILSEEDRYPLVKNSDSSVELEAQVLLKKLDII